MMRKNITRTLTRCTISAYRITKVNGKPTIEELAPVTVWGKTSEKEAEKAIAEVYGKGCMVDSIESVDEMYSIDVETFVANAVKVEQTEIEIPNADEPLDLIG